MNRATPVVLVVVGILFLPWAAEAAVQSVAWNFYDEQTGESYPENAVSIEANGTAAVPFGITGYLEIEADLEPSMATDGEIYYLSDPETGERELAGYASEVIWEREGTYEMDVYEYVLAPNRTPIQRVFAWLFPVAHAAPPHWTYIETIRFSITEGPPPAPPCCSSVLFLPGFQGSALKEGNDVLWPPSAFSDDVARLAVTQAGESVNDIRVAGVLSDFYGTPIYSGFAEFMDGLTNDGTINAWEPFSYDWRLPLATTIDEGVAREGEDNPVYLVDEVINLASESRTGKVTIIAHSMGGLLGKMLIKKLEEDGNENLIDAFVMVGTPQLGTPQSAAALLHGDQQGIAGGIFVKSHVARAVAQNMQSAYALLPSERYFEEVQDPVISFNSSASFTADWRARWGDTINTSAEFQEFITGTGVSRTSPDPQNLAQPEVLKSELTQAALALHAALDTYEFPSNIRVVQLAGWGIPTVKEIEYKTKHLIFNGYETKITTEGDDTVVYPSATSDISQETYYLDLATLNSLEGRQKISHRNLFDAEPIRHYFSSLLKKESFSIPYLLENKPNAGDLDPKLLVVTRSPVVLGAFDSEGNFTGIDEEQNLDSDVLEITEEIPGSAFIVSGEDQLIFLPKDGTYTFKFRGTGSGPATVEIGTFSGDSVTPIATYTDIPVTPETEATFEIRTEAPENVVIQIDTNGDNLPDSTVAPDGYVPPPPPSQDSGILAFTSSLKAKIQGLDLSSKQKDKLIKRVDKLERSILKLKEKKPVLFRILEAFFKKASAKWNLNNLTARKSEEILKKLEGGL